MTAILGISSFYHDSAAALIVDGEIIYKQTDLLKLSYDEMKDIRGKEISMIFQEPMTSLNPVLKIGVGKVMTNISLYKLGIPYKFCREPKK